MKKDANKTTQSYTKYSSWAFEMVAYILIGYFAGQALDKYFLTDRPYFTAGLIVLLVAGAFYKLIYQLEKDRKDNA
ncbi:MAG TPA: AtpZ/AtpI family protein [Saprospiraceae bacterium]|nr:AtpZ/AtpI family protein [Saprospiraceae bacterium]